MSNTRLAIQNLGEWYMDVLAIEAYLSQQTISSECAGILRKVLIDRTRIRESMLAELARKREMSTDDLKDAILAKKAEPITSEQYMSMVHNRSQSAVTTRSKSSGEKTTSTRSKVARKKSASSNKK